nr:FecR/PupR family sigma factor regulator [uncultured Brevundimonas sp.]
MTADKDLDARRREAASWFATLNQKRVTAADVTAFSQWRRDPKNAEAYARIETMWETAGSLKGDADIAVLTKGARARADASRKTQSRLLQSARTDRRHRRDRGRGDRRHDMVRPSAVL